MVPSPLHVESWHYEIRATVPNTLMVILVNPFE